MGVNDAFTTNANFSGISQDKNLIIDKIIQKTTIEVDENGSGYGSHSANYINKKPKRRIKKVKVNRPFLVVITTRNFIVFTGRVSKP
ncbi:hypothetical protein HCN44_004935 [Aphidius gifuensis]|uniref:Serpin domain-containing protein n=1 Tax=Aphidius gifuensis TaxID=684658 RepID=A0A834XTM5_APHGI|nr:hypothetical protein HCN44_004935 [Aphidius gifuensis]